MCLIWLAFFGLADLFWFGLALFDLLAWFGLVCLVCLVWFAFIGLLTFVGNIICLGSLVCCFFDSLRSFFDEVDVWRLNFLRK